MSRPEFKTIMLAMGLVLCSLCARAAEPVLKGQWSTTEYGALEGKRATLYDFHLLGNGPDYEATFRWMHYGARYDRFGRPILPSGMDPAAKPCPVILKLIGEERRGKQTRYLYEVVDKSQGKPSGIRFVRSVDRYRTLRGETRRDRLFLLSVHGIALGVGDRPSAAVELFRRPPARPSRLAAPPARLRDRAPRRRRAAGR